MKQCMACMHAFILWVMNASMNKSMNLPIWSSRTAPHAWVVFTIFRWNRVLATVSSLFCRPHSCPETDSFFIFCEIELSLCSVHFLSTTFADRGPQLREQRLYFGDHGESFSFQAWIHALLHFPTTWWCRGWHEDVVDMTIWLTWFWKC